MKGKKVEIEYKPEVVGAWASPPAPLPGYLLTGYDPATDETSPQTKLDPEWMKQVLSGKETQLLFSIHGGRIQAKRHAKPDESMITARAIKAPAWMQGVFYQMLEERRLNGMGGSTDPHELLGWTKWWAADVQVLIACLTDWTESAPPSIRRKGERIQTRHLVFCE